MADIKQKLREANEKFEEVDTELRDLDLELTTDETDVGEAFRLRRELLDRRDTLCTEVRGLVKQLKDSYGKFKYRPKNKRFLDSQGAVGLARELQVLEEWENLGIISTVADLKKAEEHLDEQVLAELMESALTVVPLPGAVYGPKPGDIK